MGPAAWFIFAVIVGIPTAEALVTNNLVMKDLGNAEEQQFQRELEQLLRETVERHQAPSSATKRA